MARKVRLFKSKERKNCEDTAAFLRELANRVAEGEVVVKQGADEVTLTLPDNLRLKVKGTQKNKKRGTKFKFEIQIKWLDGDRGGSGLTLK